MPLSLLSRSAPTKATARAAAATRPGNRTLLTNVLPSENAVVTFMESPSSHSPIDSHLQLRCSRVPPRFRAFSLSINSPVIPNTPTVIPTAHHCHSDRTPLSFRPHTTVIPTAHHCHSDRTPLSFRTRTPTVIPTAHHCHSEHPQLSFRPHTTVIPNTPNCHSDRTPLSFRTPPTVIPTAHHCHSEHPQLSFRTRTPLSFRAQRGIQSP